MRILIISSLVASVALTRPAEAQDGCEDLDPTSGYPVSATWIDSAGSGPGYLAEVLEAAVYRWRVPSRRRSRYRGWRGVRRRLLPPEPRWADDWRPDERHVADMPLALFRDGDPQASDLFSKSGDGRFDNSLESIAEEPVPGAPDFPTIPASVVGDSLVVLLHFGTVAPGAAVIRFAAQQSPARRITRLRTESSALPPGPWSATFKFDVLETGQVDLTWFEILRSTGPTRPRALEEMLQTARFDPAISNCRPIAVSTYTTIQRNRRRR